MVHSHTAAMVIFIKFNRIKPLLKTVELRLPWRSSGEDSVLLLQGAWVRSLVGKLRSHVLHSAAKQTNNNQKPTEKS